MTNEIQKATDTPQVQKALTTPTPADLLQFAMGSGVDVDKMTKLMDMQERWEAKQAKKAYHQAMSQFRSQCIVVGKDRRVKFGNTDYHHATLGGVMRAISEPLGALGFSVDWRTGQNDKGEVMVTCIVTHCDGHSEETTLASKPDNSGGKNAIQAIGSAVTYLQRYTLLAKLGIACAEDDDGAATGSRGPQVERRQPKESGPAPEAKREAKPVEKPAERPQQAKKEDFATRCNKCVELYAAMGVTADDLAGYVARSHDIEGEMTVDTWSEDDLTNLAKLYKNLSKLQQKPRNTQIMNIFWLSSSAVEG